MFAKRVPHEWFAFLRQNAPVWWHEEEDGPGFWAVTTLAEATQVNRDYEHFSSARKATYLWDLAEDDLAQQQLIMLNMDPPLHTRYRRLVNKGFTPRMVNQLHERIHVATDDIIDQVIETGSADFVTDIAAELPLVVIAELLGVPERGPPPDVRLVQPDDRQRRPRVPDGRRGGPDGLDGALRLRLGAVRPEAGRPPRRPDERPHPGRDRGRAALVASSSSSSSCCSPWPATRRPGT